MWLCFLVRVARRYIIACRMHCFSDEYLADELMTEFGYPINNE